MLRMLVSWGSIGLRLSDYHMAVVEAAGRESTRTWTAPCILPPVWKRKHSAQNFKMGQKGISPSLNGCGYGTWGRWSLPRDRTKHTHAFGVVCHLLILGPHTVFTPAFTKSVLCSHNWLSLMNNYCYLFIGSGEQLCWSCLTWTFSNFILQFILLAFSHGVTAAVSHLASSKLLTFTSFQKNAEHHRGSYQVPEISSLLVKQETNNEKLISTLCFT